MSFNDKENSEKKLVNLDIIYLDNLMGAGIQ
jgi:hypothetical protein